MTVVQMVFGYIAVLVSVGVIISCVKSERFHQAVAFVAQAAGFIATILAIFFVASCIDRTHKNFPLYWDAETGRTERRY